MVETLDRIVYFYQIEWELKDKSKVRRELQFFNHFLEKEEKHEFCETYDIILEKFPLFKPKKEELLQDVKYSCWKISKIRKHDLPQKYSEKTKKCTPLQLLDDEGLYEPTHFVIFNGNILASEMNHFGQQANTGLFNIINECLDKEPLPDIRSVKIKQIMKGEAYELLRKGSEFRSITIEVATPYAKELKNSENPSFKAMFSAADLINDIELVLKFTMGRKRKISSEAFSLVIETIQELVGYPGAKENIKVLKIDAKRKAYDKKFKTVNILDDYLFSTTHNAKVDDNTKGVDSEDMFNNIIDSYLDNEETLKVFTPCLE